MVRFLKNGHMRKNLTQNGKPQRASWEKGRRRRKIIVMGGVANRLLSL